MSEQNSNERSKTLIRELYQLSEAGVFDHVSKGTADAFCDSIMAFMNPVITYKEAAKMTGKTLPAIYNKISKSGIRVFERVKGIRWLDLKRIIDKRI